MRHSPWSVQPQYNVGLQRSHPLARGLALKPLLFQHYEAVNPRFPAPSLPTSGNVSLRHGPLGPAVHFNGSQTTGNSWSYSTSTTSIFSGATSLAISCAFRITSLSAESTLAAVWGSADERQFLLTVSATGQLIFGPYQDGGYTTYIRATAASTISANRDYVVCVTWSPGSLLCSVDGVTTSFTTDIFVAGTVNNINTGASTGQLQIGVKNDGNPLTGYIYDINFFVNARKNQDEINRLSANPWQLYNPVDRGIWVGAASSGSSGTVNYTNANDTSSASGTTTVTGSLAKTNSNDTSSASGTTTVTGSLAKTNANDTSSASGTTTVTGSLATTNANDTVSASGSAGSNTGTVNYTNANDTVSASGWAGIVTGTVNYTNRNDTSSGVGLVVGRGGITGDARKKRRYVAKIGDRLVVFDSADRALNAIQRDEKEPDAPIPVQSKKSLPKDAEQVQSIPVAQIKQTARVYDNEERLMQMFQRQRYAEMLALYESLKRQEDEDEVELLMLT